MITALALLVLLGLLLVAWAALDEPAVQRAIAAAAVAVALAHAPRGGHRA